MQQKEQQDKLAGSNDLEGAAAAAAIGRGRGRGGGMGTFEARPADGYSEDNGSGVEQQRAYGDSGLKQEQQDAMQRSGTFEAVVKVEDREEDHHAAATGAAAAVRMPLLKQESSSFTLTGMPELQVAGAKPAAAAATATATATAITPLSDSPASQSHAWHQQQLHGTPADGHPVVLVGAGPLPGQPAHSGDDHVFSQSAGKKEEDGDGAVQWQGHTGQYGDVIIPQRIQAYAKLEFPFFNFYIQKLSVTIGRRPPVSRTTGTSGFVKEEVHQPHEAGDVKRGNGNGVVKSEPIDDVEPLSLEPPLLEPPPLLNGAHTDRATAMEAAGAAVRAEGVCKPEPERVAGGTSEAAAPKAVTPEEAPQSPSQHVQKQEADMPTTNIESGRGTLERFGGNKVMVDVDLGPIKAVSRDHARLFFDSDVNPATGCSNGWSLEVKGRNGLVLNERWRAKGEIVRVANRSRIQIAERIFHFVLPNGVPYPTASLSPSFDDDDDSMYGSMAESEDEHRQSPARSLSPPLVYGSDSEELRSSDGGQPVPAASPPRYGQGKGKGKGSLEHLKKKAAAAAAKKLKKGKASLASTGNESESLQSPKREVDQSASFEMAPQSTSAAMPDAGAEAPTAGLPHAPIPYASNSKKQLKLPGSVSAPAPVVAAATPVATPAASLPIWFNGVDLARIPKHSLTKKQKTELGKVRRQRDKEEKAQLREKERLEREAAKQLKKEQKVKEDAEKKKKEAEKQQKKLEEANEIRNRSREEKEKAAAAAAIPATNGSSAGTPQVAGVAKPASSLDSGPTPSTTAALPPLPPLPPTPAAPGSASQPTPPMISATAPKPAMTIPIQPISSVQAQAKPKPEVSLFLPNKGLSRASPTLATNKASPLGVAASSPGVTPTPGSQPSSSRANDIPVVLPGAPTQAAPARPPAVPASAQKATVPPPPVKKATPKPVAPPRPTVPPPQPQPPIHFVPTNQFQYKPDKPPYSYAALIAQAIYSTPVKQASVQHIHAWIPERYPFFRENGALLQTAIKQNLAVNRAFLNIPQPTGAALWAVEPEHARVFDGNTFLAPVQAEPAPTPSVSRHASPPAHHASRTVTHSPSMSPAPPSFAAAASAAGPAPAASSPAPASASTSAAGGISRVPILIAPLPASYLKPAPTREPNAMLDPNGFPPIAIHEGRMYLSPPIFSTLTAQQLSNLQSIETKQALNILQAFVVNYFKVELKKRKKAEKAAAAAASASGTPAKSQTPGTKRPAEGTPDGANKQQKVS